MVLLLFLCLFLLLLLGFPVAFTLGGVAIVVGYLFLDPIYFQALPFRIYGIMANETLMAVPLFVYMGVMLERSGLAERLLETMALMFGKFRGGLALSVVIVGGLLAASTGIVGATVVMMGMISLPVMLRRGYAKPLATGTIAASGTLGQIIPPSVVLILLSSQLSNVPGAGQATVGQLFRAALWPSALLFALYTLYIVAIAWLKPAWAPAMPAEARAAFRGKGMIVRVIRALVLPLALVVLVLGSIFAGVASPTEAAAVGALGATALTAIERKLSWNVLREVNRETLLLTAMVFWILLGATAFSLVFRGLGGDSYLSSLIVQSQLSATGFLLLVMVLIFVAGFFIDFIEIIFILVPVVAPIFVQFDANLVWVGVLFALNLQTSFLSPPFGFSLFYLKGVAPPEVQTRDIYRGVIPYIAIQLIVVGLVIIFPDWVVGA